MKEKKSKVSLAELLTDKLEMPKRETKELLEKITQKLVDSLLDYPVGTKISFPELGTFMVKKTNKRKGRNPATGETVDIPEKVKLRFSPKRTVKEILIESHLSKKSKK